MTYVIVLLVLFAVVFVVTAPLRRPSDRAAAPASGPGAAADTAPELLELEAARDAKFREIRDAELDHETGKLSDADFTAIDSALRAEAVEILHRLDEAKPEQ